MCGLYLRECLCDRLLVPLHCNGVTTLFTVAIFLLQSSSITSLVWQGVQHPAFPKYSNCDCVHIPVHGHCSKKRTIGMLKVFCISYRNSLAKQARVPSIFLKGHIMIYVDQPFTPHLCFRWWTHRLCVCVSSLDFARCPSDIVRVEFDPLCITGSPRFKPPPVTVTINEDWQQSRTPSFLEFRMLYDTLKKLFKRWWNACSKKVSVWK